MDIVNTRFQQLIDSMRAYHAAEADIAMVEKAYALACRAHDGQVRKDGVTPFVSHPLEVALIVLDMQLDAESIAAALLHDVIEDCDYSYNDIKRSFGHSVAGLCEGLTKLSRIKYSTEQEQQMEDLRKMFLAMSKDIRVIIIKIADRLHNMRTLGHLADEKRRATSRETMEIYAPLAHRLGMQKFKLELEDLALMYLDPEGYREISEGLQAYGRNFDELLVDVERKLRERLDDMDIEAKIEGRVKHIYSIYRKMYGQNKQLQEINDLYAIRVIVETVADCYHVLGIIHELYHGIPGHFKDYISMPKPNMYQSLHTTVLGREGIPFEAQIRTWDMHQTAEYGIAAHWKYKSGETSAESVDQKLEWVRRLIEHQSDVDAEDFISSVKVDMFADDVFVFTPKGDVINLPATATVIDFAYAIHSEVGNRMVNARVNGKQVNFESYRLQTGDIVEIVTNKAREGPSRDWLNIVTTNEARSKIKQWFKHMRRDENIATGRERLEDELKRANIPLATVMQNDVIPVILEKLKYRTLDDLYAAVGYGGTSAGRVLNRIRDELIRLKKLGAPEPSLPTPPSSPHASRSQKSNMGVIVEDIGNCQVKFARCCNPIPGDDIIGFTTKGHGVSIHRRDCENVKPDNSGRWLSVHWAAQPSNNYLVPVQVNGRNRDGLVADVASAVNTLKVNFTALKAAATVNDEMIIDIVLQVSSIESLQSVLSQLRRVEGCQDVRRV